MFNPRRWLAVPLAVLGAGLVTAALLAGTMKFYGLAAGGLIAVLPGFAAMWPIARRLAAGQAPGLGRMLFWESAKWLMTAALFTAVFVWLTPPLPAPWLFAGFILGQAGLAGGLIALARGPMIKGNSE